MSERSPNLREAFAQRMLDGLLSNNVLRGAWAEEIVGFYLGDGVEFAEQWCFYDIRFGGRTVSVKHSIGSTARFNVERRTFAWDPDLAHGNSGPPYTTTNPEGWRGHPDVGPQYWCDLYVFAWLPEAATVDDVLNPNAWRFTVLNRSDMHRFPLTSKTVGVARLTELSGGFLTGEGLRAAAQSCLANLSGDAIPALDDRPYEEISEGLAYGK